jgi:hypothetical protein
MVFMQSKPTGNFDLIKYNFGSAVNVHQMGENYKK